MTVLARASNNLTDRLNATVASNSQIANAGFSCRSLGKKSPNLNLSLCKPPNCDSKIIRKIKIPRPLSLTIVTSSHSPILIRRRSRRILGTLPQNYVLCTQKTQRLSLGPPHLPPARGPPLTRHYMSCVPESDCALGWSSTQRESTGSRT
jgi:hypothetical protein